MAYLLVAKAPPGTYTGKRHWAGTETRNRRETTVKQRRDRAQGDSNPPVDLIEFESSSNVYEIVLGRNDEFIVLASDDWESAILKTPGAGLSSRLQRALPLVASYTPLAGSDYGDVIERLLRFDVSIPLERVPSSPATQLELSADKWMAQVWAWASSHPQRDCVVDDSRESIYDDRG